MKNLRDDALPCPVCACPADELIVNEWHLEGGTVDAFECPRCYAGAPVASWNIRDPEFWKMKYRE